MKAILLRSGDETFKKALGKEVSILMRKHNVTLSFRGPEKIGDRTIMSTTSVSFWAKVSDEGDLLAMIDDEGW